MRKKVKSGKHGKGKIVLWIFGIIAVSFIGTYAYLNFQLNKIAKVDIPKSNAELDISNDAANLDSGITNIALFGVDSRDSSDTGRSDSIMVLSIDKVHNKIKISSVMRDTYVKVAGHGMTKITHAYAYGGPTLAIKTLNSNFDLNIRNYATVNFEGMAKIIDSLGGVQVDVKSNEVHYLNLDLDEIAKLDHSSLKHVTSKGLQNLNGVQAVAYSRIRMTGNGDFERTDRQRTVLTALLEKVKAGGAIKFPGMVSSILPDTTTSFGQLDILALGTSVLTSNMSNIDQVRFPVDGYCKGETIGGVYYLVANLNTTTDQIHQFIYDDLSPSAK
jgi:LCP family protein required for cell wall assembly